MRPVLALLALLALSCANLVTQGSDRAPPRGTTRHALEVGKQDRSYLLHVPASYDGKTAVPLVLFLHGRGNNAENAMATYGFRELAEEHGFLLAVPDALRRDGISEWQFGYRRRDTDADLRFLERMIDTLTRGYRIDPRRVFVCGHSFGGMMSHSAAADPRLGPRIAAIAVVAGPIGILEGTKRRTIPVPKQAMPVLSFHARDDRTVPFSPELARQLDAPKWLDFVSAEESVAFWVEHDRCREEPETQRRDEGRIAVHRYSGGRHGSEVVFYELATGGHDWPTRRTHGLDAGRLIWDFFARHPQPAPGAKDEPPHGK